MPLHMTMRGVGKPCASTSWCASIALSASRPFDAVFRNEPTNSALPSCASNTVASMPTFCSAIAATGPPIPHPMTSAVLAVFCVFVMRTVSRAGAGPRLSSSRRVLQDRAVKRLPPASSAMMKGHEGRPSASEMPFRRVRLVGAGWRRDRAVSGSVEHGRSDRGGDSASRPARPSLHDAVAVRRPGNRAATGRGVAPPAQCAARCRRQARDGGLRAALCRRLADHRSN